MKRRSEKLRSLMCYTIAQSAENGKIKAGPARTRAPKHAPGMFLSLRSCPVRISPTTNKKADPPPMVGDLFFWRRWRDSNSRRAFDPYTISNRARSTNYATSPRVCSRKSYQLVSLPIIMQPSGKVKQYFCAPRRCASVPLFTGKMPCFLRIVFPRRQIIMIV